MEPSIALLQWYVDAGVEDALLDEPRNYFISSTPPPVETPARHSDTYADSPPVVAPPSPAASPVQILHHIPSAAIAEARKLADAAETLEALEQAVRNFDGCSLKRTATKTVFSDGNPAAKLMLIGEAPGAQEDMQGIPFCGPSGLLLDKMLAGISHDRTNTYITNTLFWRPPGNRPPSPEELAICKPFVERHIALIDPALIVLVGGTALKGVLGQDAGITRLRGKHYALRTPYGDKEYPVAVIYHPSYLLRSPVHKRVTWQDLLAIKATLSSSSTH